MLQTVGMHAYLLHDPIEFVKPMVKLPAWTRCLDNFTWQLYYVINLELAGLCTTIAILMLGHSDHLPALINESLELQQLLRPCLCIRHITDRSVGLNGPDGSLYAKMETFFSKEQPNARETIDTVAFGELSSRQPVYIVILKVIDINAQLLLENLFWYSVCLSGCG
jgi:hypothetical protein